MNRAAELHSGKGAQDENFPVASRLVRRELRPPILAFYDFVRTADDIADHSSLDETAKFAGLDRLEASLTDAGGEPEGQALRSQLEARGLSPQHALDLLSAFRQDVTKRRYRNWDELIDYCARSAMPVGRFVLDVHGESRATWPASDALCAALQIINHMQDCGKDYRGLDRVYIPLDLLAAEGLEADCLGANVATPPLRKCLREMALRVAGLLKQSRSLAGSVADARLAMEIAAIQALAERIAGLLLIRDPLSQPVHLSKGTMLMTSGGAACRTLWRRLFRKPVPARRYQTP
jgi:squalene synthase HpnC